jgi:glycosyltransferase involved in cell wall biosynthesis
MGSSVISKILNPSWKFVIKFCNKCNFVTAPTETAVELLKMHGLKVKYQAVSNGIDTDRFKPRGKNKNLIEKFHIPDLPIVLYTGRISEEKQIHTLIQAIPEILKKVNCHFVICGDGPVRAQLENMVLDLKIKDKVSFLGFLTEKDLPFIYNLADVYVMPSICELQSITTLEALASALPVVACNKYALKELVLDGKNGFLFKPADTNDLSEKITKILLDEELRERMKKESLKIVKKHSLENTIKQYEEIYLNLINFKNYST